MNNYLPTSAKPVGPSGTASSRVFDNLRKDLVGGRFAAGEKLAINALKERYQVGLSPLREALNRLAPMGCSSKRTSAVSVFPSCRGKSLMTLPTCAWRWRGWR